MEAEKLRQYLDDLQGLVNVDSVSSEPNGAGRVADFFQTAYQEMGWQVEEVRLDESIGKCLKITNREAEHYDVLLLAHLDTVFPVGTAARRPFSRDAKRAYGPGVIDCKGGALSALYVLRELETQGELEQASICVFLNTDHEGISSRYSHEYSVSLAKKSSCVLVLEAARANGSLVNRRKGIARYHLEIKGVSAHAGVDFEQGRSAVVELAHWIQALSEATELKRGTTVNFGTVSGGTAISAVPGEARAAIDVRYFEESEIKRVEAMMEELAAHPVVPDTQATLSGGITRPPMLPTEKTEELCRLIEAAGEAVGVPVRWMTSGGGSDGSFAAAAGVPTVDGLGPQGGGAHSEGEYLELDSIGSRCALLRKVLLLLLVKCKGGNE